MSRRIARIKGLGFIFWHARHECYHVLLGLMWAWFLREQWGMFNPRWIWLAIFGSLLPDADHIVYFFTYGRRDIYTKQVRQLLRGKQWRNLFVYMEQGHKHNTNLISHNYYVMALLLITASISSFVDWQAGVILFGAMLIHYFFDVLDDLFILGRVNPNWRRWGREHMIGASRNTRRRLAYKRFQSK